jgi:glycosyltransferase involved in cell wall biosynthesis
VAAPARVERVLNRMIWEQLSLPRLARRLGVDVVHSPHYTFPLAMRATSVVTVHDLTFFTLPEAHSTVKRYFFRWWIRTIARKRLAVIADSQSTADDFASIAGGSPERVTVSHLGYDDTLFHRPDDAAEAALRGAVVDLPSTWIAFLGTLEPRKNVAALIDGYTAAVLERPTAGRPALLLAGGKGWDDEVAPAVERATEAGVDVRRLGYLPLESLSAFLGRSTVFVYPSLGEGFGLPVLEAMATGACVLTTDLTSLPEVGGDAVAYTGVGSSDISTALRTLLDDDAARDRLSTAAVQRAAGFTWTAAAARHRSAYAMAVS